MEDKKKKAEKALGEPVFIYFSDEVHRTRRNLVILTFIALAYKLSGAQIDSFHPLGIQFKNHNPDFIDQAFFAFLLYSLVHFLWQSIDALQEWKLRLTGTRLVHVTTAISASPYGDYPNDPRQSTLMTWWKHEARKIGNFRESAKELESTSTAFKAALEKAKSEESTDTSTIVRSISELNTKLTALSRQIGEAMETIESERIPVSLDRFEKAYKLFSYSQLARWLIIEWGLPIVLAIWAMYLVCPFTPPALLAPVQQ